MIKFKKVFGYKIVMLLILAIFSFEGMAYSISEVRVPFLDTERVDKALRNVTDNDLEDIWTGQIKPRWDYDFNIDKWIALLAFAGERGMQYQVGLKQRIQNKLSIISIQCLLRAFLSLSEDSIEAEKSRFIDEPCPPEDSDAFEQYSKTFHRNYRLLLSQLSSEQIRALAIFFMAHITPAQMYSYRYRAKYKIYDESNLFIVFQSSLADTVCHIDVKLSEDLEELNAAAQVFGTTLEAYDRVGDLSNFPFTRLAMEHNRNVPVEKAFVSAILHQERSFERCSYLDIAGFLEAEVSAHPPLFLMSFVSSPADIPHSHTPTDVSL